MMNAKIVIDNPTSDVTYFDLNVFSQSTNSITGAKFISATQAFYVGVASQI